MMMEMLATASSSSSLDLVAWVIVPLIIFVLGASGTGIMLLIKGSAYMTRSQLAQESTAESNQEIAAKLDKYIDRSEERFGRLDVRVSILETKLPPKERTNSHHE